MFLIVESSFSLQKELVWPALVVESKASATFEYIIECFICERYHHYSNDIGIGGQLICFAGDGIVHGEN